MPAIGYVAKQANGSFKGQLRTLTIRAEVEIIPNRSKANEHQPDYRVQAGGIEVGAGEFVWRPAGSRHTAWSPKGGMFIAMFQIPNKFFDVDGKVVDASGKEWDPAWAHLLPA